jgi:25S rRNA (uracil2843-N3)-methyltransferase
LDHPNVSTKYIPQVEEEEIMVPPSKVRRNARASGKRRASECQANKLEPLPTSNPTALSTISVELQQKMLNVFRDAFSSRMNQEFPQLLQAVKMHLFNRQFQKAFEGEALLETYAFRWSPSRALAYVEILSTIPPLPDRLGRSSNDTITEAGQGLASTIDSTTLLSSNATADGRLETEQQSQPSPPNDPDEEFGIVCLGGGSGAELVALAGYLRWIGSAHHQSPTKLNDQKKSIRLKINIVDIADWSNVIRMLHCGVTTSPPISKYASTAAKANNTALTDADNFRVHFQHCDILNLSLDELKSVFREVKLVTVMFTLNELYSTSIPATTSLLLSMTSILTPGALLLVVDSPGSYSTINVGQPTGENDTPAPKKYPMQWLLDHTLLESASVVCGDTREQEKRWEKVHSQDSNWFRLADELMYPFDLEDMRYQIHLYERK